MHLTVVVASIESRLALEAALTAFARACEGLEAEVLWVDASRDGSAERAAGWGEPVRVLRLPPGTLAPDLWGAGIRASRGRFVALSTGHCVVGEDWARRLTRALEAGAAAAGAGLRLLPQATAVDRAVFYLRYAAFLDLTGGPERDVPELPGDNVAYHGPDVRAWLEAREGGFWELEFHAALRENGRTLRAVPAAAAGFGRAFPFSTILRHRFDHGRHFGAWRVGPGGESVLRVAGAAPLVPPVLALRKWRQARGSGAGAGGFVSALGPFLALAGAWAAGEAVGALRGRLGAESRE